MTILAIAKKHLQVLTYSVVVWSVQSGKIHGSPYLLPERGVIQKHWMPVRPYNCLLQWIGRKSPLASHSKGIRPNLMYSSLSVMQRSGGKVAVGGVVGAVVGGAVGTGALLPVPVCVCV